MSDKTVEKRITDVSYRKINILGKKIISLSNLQLFIAWILLVIILSIMTPFFYKIKNFANIGVAVSVMGITAAGMTVVLVSGGIDLTVGSMIGFSGIIIGKLLTGNVAMIPAVLITLTCGVAIGLANGLIIVNGKINPLITTLGMMSIIRGFAFVWAGGVSHAVVSSTFGFIGRGEIVGVPNPIIIMAVVYVFLFLIMTYSRFGRYMYSIGGNASASRRMGIKIHKYQYFFYMISGGLASLSGVLLSSLMQASLPRSGMGYELDIIAAVILGGTSLAGGIGSIQGTVLGVLILGTLNNGMTLLNVPAFYQKITKGTVLLIAVFIDQLRLRKK